MKKRVLLIISSLLFLCAISLAALQTFRLNRANLALAEIRRHALYQTAEEMQRVALDLEKLTVSSQPALQTPLLYSIARASADVAQQLSLLPFSHAFVADTLHFVSDLEACTASLLQSPAAKLTEAQHQQLARALTTSRQLSAQLALLWIQDTPPYPGSSHPDNDPAVQQLDSLSSSVDYPPASEPAFVIPRGLPEGEVTREDARSFARAYAPDGVVCDAPDTSGYLPAYGFSVISDGVQLNMEFTRQGGRLLWMMPETAAFPMTQSPAACEKSAIAFLLEHGFGECQAVHRQIYDGLCVVSAVPLQDDILLYPDMLTVQVRMDTRQVVGLEARSYWTNHVRRDLAPPAISSDSALQHLDPSLTCTAQQLCLIPYNGAELLCWQCTVHRSGEVFYIYIDAETGREAAIRKLIPLENGTTVA